MKYKLEDIQLGYYQPTPGTYFFSLNPGSCLGWYDVKPAKFLIRDKPAPEVLGYGYTTRPIPKALITLIKLSGYEDRLLASMNP